MSRKIETKVQAQRWPMEGFIGHPLVIPLLVAMVVAAFAYLFR